jgi:16S rRNA C967 or C1407 C5-methylase (RsmB/RsmF family)/NOL1/NOP2/fmu family ribosome biogenesis protein
MFPDRFIQRIRTQEYIDPDGLLNSLKEASPISIRINGSKWSRNPHSSEPVPWCTAGYWLGSRPSFTLDPLFHAGCYYPQEASGMFLEQIFKQVAGRGEEYIRALDLCGAPGGKSTHLASLIGSNGLLVSNEVIRTRASVLAENISKWGASNSIVTQSDPSAFSRLEGFFDLILVDAPCSGEGMFRDTVAVNEWSEENTNHCSERQRRILTDIWPALSEGGLLIYSTCTFNPGENEENISWLISSHNAKCVELDVSEYDGITEIDHQGIKGYGFYPGRIKGEGLFVSVIRKTGFSQRTKPVARRKQRKELQRSDLAIVREWTNFAPDKIFRLGDEIYYNPASLEDYAVIESRLKLISPGIRICSVKKNSYVPSHELALSSGIGKEAFFKAELDYGQALAYLRRDNMTVTDIPKGWFIASYKGINLGFCNNIGSRINNYYPMDWRIRMRITEAGIKNIILWDS